MTTGKTGGKAAKPAARRRKAAPKAAPKAEAKAKAKAPETGKATAAGPKELDPAVLKQITELRRALRQSYAQVVMAMSMLPRYQSQMLSDLTHLVMDPMLRDRLTTAYKPAPEDSGLEPDIAGFAIWASVSDEVDARIRAQIKGGVFPVKLKPEDWTSGEINWLLDVISPDPKMTASVVANFARVANKGRELHLHPLVSRMVDPELLKQLGARKGPRPEEGTETAPETAES